MNETERDALEGKLRDQERQLAQAARKEIDVERESQDALAQAEELRRAALEREQQLITEVAQTKLERDSLSQHLEAAQSRADELRTSSGTSNYALQQKQAEVHSVRETNRLLDGKLQQLQSQLHEQAASTKQARETVIELTKARGDLDMKRMHAENELRQCQHARQSLEVEKDLLQKDVASLQTQLADKSESLRQSWADANAKAHELEQQLQGAQSQQQALSASNKQFEQLRDRLSEQLQTAEKERQDAQSQLQEQKATFEEELASLHTLASRHKEERLALEHDKQALAGLVQELTRKAEAFKADQQQASAQLQQRLDTAEQACQERDQTIERFKHAMEDTGNPALPQASSNAATASSALGQQSPVQVYSQYVDLVHEHDKLKEEHSRLQADWLQFEQNVIPEAQKAQQLAKRNVDLDEANAKLSAQVQVANLKAKRCIDATYKWQGQFDDEKSAHGVTRKLLKEAQHQVVLLANENRQLNGVRERAVMPAWSNAILAANLVEFKDTQDLVAKNEALRRLAHELQMKAEQQLKQKDSDAHGREQQMMKSYEDSLAAARQQNAVAMEQMQHLMWQRDSAQQAAKTAAERQTAGSDAQQGGSGQSERSSQLAQELSRLREDGHAYREELRQQLDTARQAAAQANHEAAQSRAALKYEANRVQQLQDDKALTDSTVESWKQQGREQQELISSLNRRLDQLHNQASRAQDEASQRRQRAAVLEAQNELLNKDNQRLLHESTDHAAARYRLEAERDTQQRLSSQQHDDDAKERARLHAELSAIQRQLADSQKQLTEEQAYHRHSFTAQEAADDRLAKVQEARDKLQQDLSRQLANSEAKVAALQTAAQKGEEKAASLELQLSAKATPVSGGEMCTDVGSSSKEAELLQTIADLRKDLQQAQQQAAQEAGHVAQFRSLAESAEENTKTVQEQVANLKSEAAKAAEQLQKAKSKTEDAEKDLNANRQSAYEDSQAAIKDKQQAHTTISNLQAELVIAKKHATTEAERYQKIVTDLAAVNKELKQAQSSYNKSVLEHAETVKKLSEQETRVTRLQQEQAAHETAVELAHRGKAAADQAWQQERSKLQTALQAAQQRLHDLERVNAQLQVHLETHAREAAGQAPDEGSKLAGLVQYLQKRLRTLESENISLEQLSSRLRTDLEAASKRATQADQARLETAEKLRSSLRSQEDQERLMHQVQETNLLRESNVTLRSMSEQNRKEKEAWSRRAQDVEAQAQPLKRRVQELEAVAESDQQNVDYLKEQVQSGQRRIAELLHKATAVDKEEYDRVVQEGDAFRNKLSTEQAVVKELTSANIAAQSSLASIQAEVTRLTAAAKADQDNLRSTQSEVSRLQLLADQADSLQASVASLETEVRTKANTIEKNRNVVKTAQGLVASMNPEGLSSTDWRTDMTRKLQERIDLQQQRDKLQQSCAGLESDNAQLKTDLTAAQAEMSKTSTANASSLDQQQQQQAELAKVQGAEQSLHLQVTSLTHELKQKDSRLEGLSTDKQQAEEQLAKLSAELGTVKAQLEGMPGAVQIEGIASHVQNPAATTSNEQELATRQAAVQQAEAALHTQQQQLNTDKQEVVQHQQSLTATQQQLVEQQQQLARHEQQVQEQEVAHSQKAGQLDEQKSQLQAQDGASSLAAQEQGQRQEASAAQVQQMQKRMTDLEKIVRTRNTTIERFKQQVSQLRTSKVKSMEIAKCTVEGKAEVVKALEQHVKIMEEHLTQAGLAVPDELDTKSIFETARDKCMAEKAKLAADEKAEGQVSPGAAPKAVTAAKPAHSSAAANADAAAPGADAAEIEAVRLAALASMNKQAGGAQDTLGLASKQAAGVTPMLRLRPTVVQQGGKRERDASPSAPASIQAQTGGDPPPAKRVRAPTPVENAPSAVNAPPATLPAGSSAVVEADVGGAPVNVVADSKQQQLSAASPAPPAAQQHVARVAVAQHDPDHVQVNIELPTALVNTEDASHPQSATQPAPSAPAEGTEHNATGDVDMTEAAAGGGDVEQEAKSAAGGEEAEDGELPGAGDNVPTGSQAQGTQNLDSSGAAAGAGQTDGSDGDGANPAARKPREIVFTLPPPAAAPSEAPQPSAPATAAQQRGGRAPTARGGASGRRGGTAAGRSVASAARGAPSKGRGRGRH